MAARKTVANLLLRFPSASQEEVEEALLQCDNHGGKATALLAKTHKPQKPAEITRAGSQSRRSSVESEQEDEFTAARRLLEPYRDLNARPPVSTRKLASLREMLPDVPEATLALELLRSEGDVERAKSWLWGVDQGAAWRREQATDISSWVHSADGELAIFSSGPWTKKRLVLERAHQTYAYMEEVWSQYESAGRMERGISRTRHAGGKWVMEVRKEGFLVAARGSMTTVNFNPQLRARLDEQQEDDEQLLWISTAPFPDLEEVRASLPTASKADKIKRRFREIDRNRDGLLDVSELKTLLTCGGSVSMSDREVNALFRTVDKDGSGSISFDEFVDYLYPDQASAKAVNRAIYGSWEDDESYRRKLKHSGTSGSFAGS